MTKLLGAAVLALALVGCGGPLEDDGTDATGAARQELLKPDGPRSEVPAVNKTLRDCQADLVRIPEFQERMHLTNPIHPVGGCGK